MCGVVLLPSASIDVSIGGEIGVSSRSGRRLQQPMMPNVVVVVSGDCVAAWSQPGPELRRRGGLAQRAHQSHPCYHLQQLAVSDS